MYFVASFVGQMVAIGCIVVVGLRTRIGTSAFVGFGIQIVVVGSTIGEMPASSPVVGNFDWELVASAIGFVAIRDCVKCSAVEPNWNSYY